MTLCYLGLGSNLRSPERQLRQAIASIRQLPNSITVSVSKLYKSRPLGVRAQPTFYNLVLAMHTSLPPQKLLHYCRRIEKKQQQIRKQRWGARALDIDVLLYGNLVMKTPSLTIPHSQMLLRDFVLVPLLEIAPFAQLPTGQLIAPHLNHCEQYVFK